MTFSRSHVRPQVKLYQFRLCILQRKTTPCPHPHPTVFRRVLLQQWVGNLKTEWVRKRIHRERLEGKPLLVAS